MSNKYPRPEPSGDWPDYFLSMRPYRLVTFPDARRFIITPVDVPSTSEHDAKCIFEDYKADGVILEAYMGMDCLEPFLKYCKPVWTMVRAWPSKDAVAELIAEEDGKPIWIKIGEALEAKA